MLKVLDNLFNKKIYLDANVLYRVIFILKSWQCLQSPDMQVWTNDYLRGTGMEMYTETLSPSFTGMPFAHATE